MTNSRHGNSAPLKSPARVAAVDYGTRRVGLALADPLGLFAQPAGTFSPREAVQRLVLLHRTEGLGTVVVGWPLKEDGQEGQATRRVKEFMAWLRRVLPGVRLVPWDEGYTSEEAKSRLADRGEGYSKERVDAFAAGIILQEYLDSRSPSADPAATADSK